MAAWQQLAYRGDVEDYLKQYDKLTLCYPLSHALTLAQATQPLGSEVKAGAQRVDMQYRREGMSHRQLRQYLEFYLRELKPHESRTLAEKSVIRGGFGAMPSHKGRTQLHQARDVNTTLTDREGVVTDASYGKTTSMPKPLQSAVWGEELKDGSLGQRRPKKIGKGPRPCWVCGSDRHNMFLCPRQLKTSAKYKICGSEAHLTKECHQRYFLQVEGLTRSEGQARPKEAERRALASTGRAKRMVKPMEGELSKESTKEGTPQEKRPILASACLMANPQGTEMAASRKNVDGEALRCLDKSKQILLYTIYIDRVPMEALLDTGATHSFIEEQWARDHSIPVYRGPKAEIEFFNKQSTTVRWEAFPQVMVGREIHRWTLQVLKVAPYAVVLGLDALRKWNLAINPQTLDLYVLGCGNVKARIESRDFWYRDLYFSTGLPNGYGASAEFPEQPSST